VPGDTVVPSSTVNVPLEAVTFSQGSARGAGPRDTVPSGKNRDPWHGHSNPSAFAFTTQPKCVQIVETA
jgi:hypothetical protein